MRGLADQSRGLRPNAWTTLILPGRAVLSPSGQKQSIGAEEEGKADEGGQEMDEIEIADGKMNTDCASESRAAHDGDNLDQAPVEIGASRHEQKEATNRAKAAAESCAIMGDDRDQCGRYPAERGYVESNEFEIGGNEDPGHAQECDGETGENEAECASSQEDSSPSFEPVADFNGGYPDGLK